MRDRFIEVTGEPSIREEQCTSLRRTIAEDGGVGTGDVRAYVTLAAKADGPGDAIGVHDVNAPR